MAWEELPAEVQAQALEEAAEAARRRGHALVAQYLEAEAASVLARGRPLERTQGVQQDAFEGEAEAEATREDAAVLEAAAQPCVTERRIRDDARWRVDTAAEFLLVAKVPGEAQPWTATGSYRWPSEVLGWALEHLVRNLVTSQVQDTLADLGFLDPEDGADPDAEDAPGPGPAPGPA